MHLENSPRDKTAAVLFDLDGTLIDTAGEIADAVNDVLTQTSISAPLPHDLIRNWIGHGAKVLFTKALKHCDVPAQELEAKVEQHWQLFYEAYRARSGTNSNPYPAMRECIDALRHANIKLAVVTNKDSAFTQRVLAAHGLLDCFDAVTCGDTYEKKKPDPLPLLATLEQLATSTTEGLFIGDSMTDVRTGKAARVETWVLTHGYHQGAFAASGNEIFPERFLDHFTELRKLIYSSYIAPHG